MTAYTERTCKTMANNVKLRIFGKDYTIATEEQEGYARKLAAMLDQKMAKISKGQSLSKLDAAALVALDCADEAYKASANLENIRSQIKKYADDASKAMAAADEAKKECDKLKAEIKKLEKELAVRKALSTGNNNAK